jgi:ABC-type transport system involved in cytochrome bd biosynthesis fused ATPase/permease subunit
MTDPAPATPPADPVRARRAQLAHFCKLAQRVGYSLFAVAVVVFFIGFFAGFTDTIVTIIVATMAVGSVLLAPAIVVSYAVKAAERDDLEHGR